jgi:hypothetical protein
MEKGYDGQHASVEDSIDQIIIVLDALLVYRGPW